MTRMDGRGVKDFAAHDNYMSSLFLHHVAFGLFTFVVFRAFYKN